MMTAQTEEEARRARAWAYGAIGVAAVAGATGWYLILTRK